MAKDVHNVQHKESIKMTPTGSVYAHVQKEKRYI
jgi:hypothetical protein